MYVVCVAAVLCVCFECSSTSPTSPTSSRGKCGGGAAKASSSSTSSSSTQQQLQLVLSPAVARIAELEGKLRACEATFDGDEEAYLASAQGNALEANLAETEEKLMKDIATMDDNFNFYYQDV